MSRFDAYHKWLGIRPKDQPPDHYRLLGIDLFEADADVIDAAAEQRMVFISQCATGPHLEDSQRLLNEIAAARLCLLNPQEKDRYDADLMLRRGESAPMAVPQATSAPIPLRVTLPERSNTRPGKKPWKLRTAMIAGTLVLVGLVGASAIQFLITKHSQNSPEVSDDTPAIVSPVGVPSSTAQRPAQLEEDVTIIDIRAPADEQSVIQDIPRGLLETDLDELTFTQTSAPTRQALAEYRLRRIGQVLHGYHADNRAFPLTSYLNPDLAAEERLSWLVALLPYLKQSTAFDAIKLDEPWNSEANTTVTQLKVTTFTNPILPDSAQEPAGVNHFVGIAGVGRYAERLPVNHPQAGLFGENRVTTLSDITDGTSNTMAVGEAGRDFGPWAAGGWSTVRSLTASPYINGPDGLGGGHGMNVLMADGSVRSLTITTDDRVVRALATIAGGDDAPALSEAEIPQATKMEDPKAAAVTKAEDRGGREWSANGLGMRFCWCPAGECLLGHPRPKGFTPSKSSQPVKFATGFFMGKYEVTQGQWKIVMGSEPWRAAGKVSNIAECPASFVTWKSAKSFCMKLTELERKARRLADDLEYRLPREAEWEYACRAGTPTLFSFGDGITGLPDYGWFRGNTRNFDSRHPHPVGLKRPNPWGLHDMHGNVDEWCEDLLEVAEERKDKSRSSEKNEVRAIRGGNWNRDADFCASTVSLGKHAIDRDNLTGFRIVLAPRR